MAARTNSAMDLTIVMGQNVSTGASPTLLALVGAETAGMPRSTGSVDVAQVARRRFRNTQTIPTSAMTATTARAGIQTAPASDAIDRPPRTARTGPAQHTAQAPSATTPAPATCHGLPVLPA
jgi:hypothetical protein